MGQSKRQLQPCGTRAAAKRHKYRGDPPCDACSAAIQERSRARDARPAEVRSCQRCGISFERLRPDGRPPKYCSVPCRILANSERQCRSAGDPEKSWPRSRQAEAEVCEKYLSGLSAESLKAEYGVNAETIRRVLRRNNVQMRAGYASTPRKRRKGGRIKDRHGYVLVLIDPSDSLYGMTQAYAGVREGQARYALEHRIVAARRLGRSLKPFEHVHHINGHRDDNRPENLELWAQPSRAGMSQRQPKGQRVADLVAFVTEFYPELVVEALARAA